MTTLPSNPGDQAPNQGPVQKTTETTLGGLIILGIIGFVFVSVAASKTGWISWLTGIPGALFSFGVMVSSWKRTPTLGPGRWAAFGLGALSALVLLGSIGGNKGGLLPGGTSGGGVDSMVKEWADLKGSDLKDVQKEEAEADAEYKELDHNRSAEMIDILNEANAMDNVLKANKWRTEKLGELKKDFEEKKTKINWPSSKYRIALADSLKAVSASGANDADCLLIAKSVDGWKAVCGTVNDIGAVHPAFEKLELTPLSCNLSLPAEARAHHLQAALRLGKTLPKDGAQAVLKFVEEDPGVHPEAWSPCPEELAVFYRNLAALGINDHK